MRLLLLVALILTIATVACRDSLESDPSDVHGSHVTGLEPATSGQPEGFLPYGVPVPERMDRFLVPEPYDPRKHVLQPNTTAHKNLKGKPGVNLTDLAALRAKHTQSSHSLVSSSFTNDEIRGWDILSTNGGGIYSADDHGTDIYIPPQDVDIFLFAPTHMTSGGSCIEMVTEHRRKTTDFTTVHRHGYWDHCSGSTPAETDWGFVEPMDAEWRNTYLIDYGPDIGKLFFSEVDATTSSPQDPQGGCWEGVLYNRLLGQWELKWQSCGTNVNSEGKRGWSLWESFGTEKLPSCLNFADVTSNYIWMYDQSAGSWRDLEDYSIVDRIGGDCWRDGVYTWLDDLAQWEPHTSWRANTP